MLNLDQDQSKPVKKVNKFFNIFVIPFLGCGLCFIFYYFLYKFIFKDTWFLYSGIFIWIALYIHSVALGYWKARVTDEERERKINKFVLGFGKFTVLLMLFNLFLVLLLVLFYILK
jgi:hypothetical protein